jgi:hypothetical protein
MRHFQKSEQAAGRYLRFSPKNNYNNLYFVNKTDDKFYKMQNNNVIARNNKPKIAPLFWHYSINGAEKPTTIKTCIEAQDFLFVLKIKADKAHIPNKWSGSNNTCLIVGGVEHKFIKRR